MRIKRMLDRLMGSPFERLTILQNEFAKMQYELETLQKVFQEKYIQLEDITNGIFANRALVARREWKQVDYNIPQPGLKSNNLSLEQAYLELKRLAPDAFDQWEKLFQVNAEEYMDEPSDSCSVGSNPYALRFKEFIAPYLNGNVLDVGCGPQAMPLYLENYPMERIFGIDPLPPHEPHPFQFRQAICEFLPWEDDSFQTILVCTSFDHVLLLDKAMNEIKRVLTNGGMLLFVASIQTGAIPYNPYQAGIQPVDRFHLFHFDRPWLEKMLEEYNFKIVEHHSYIAGHYYACQLNK